MKWHAEVPKRILGAINDRLTSRRLFLALSLLDRSLPKSRMTTVTSHGADRSVVD